MEISNRILIDRDFAQQLDLNCTNCMEEYADNKGQLRTISRKPKTTGERRALAGLMVQCNRCFVNERNFGDSITASSSCLWRAGIE